MWSFIFPLITAMKGRSKPLITWRVTTEKKIRKLSSPHCKAEMLVLWHILGQNAASCPAPQYPWLGVMFPSRMTLGTFFPATYSKTRLFHVKKKDTWDVHLATAEEAERDCSCFSKSLPIPEVSLDNSGRETLSCLKLQHGTKSRHSLCDYQWE